jgi:BRCA1 C Terminus (BRCT) domain
MPKINKQKIDLSTLFYNCIFVISNTQKDKNNLKKHLKKIGANVYENFVTKRQNKQ